MWLSVFPDQEISFAIGQPNSPKVLSQSFPTLDKGVEFLKPHLNALNGIVVFTGPGRLTLVRGATSFCLGLSLGKKIPLIGLNLRSMLQLGWAGPGPITVLTEPVRGTLLSYQRFNNGSVRRSELKKIPKRTGSLLIFPSAKKHISEEIQALTLRNFPALELLNLIPLALQAGGASAFSAVRQLDYPKAAV